MPCLNPAPFGPCKCPVWTSQTHMFGLWTSYTYTYLPTCVTAHVQLLLMWQNLLLRIERHAGIPPLCLDGPIHLTPPMF